MSASSSGSDVSANNDDDYDSSSESEEMDVSVLLADGRSIAKISIVCSACAYSLSRLIRQSIPYVDRKFCCVGA